MFNDLIEIFEKIHERKHTVEIYLGRLDTIKLPDGTHIPFTDNSDCMPNVINLYYVILENNDFNNGKFIAVNIDGTPYEVTLEAVKACIDEGQLDTVRMQYVEVYRKISEI